MKNHSRNLHARSDQRHFISFESGNGSHTVYIIQETLVYPVACENNMHRFVLLLQKLGNHIHSCDMLIQKSKDLVQYQKIAFLGCNYLAGKI